MSNRVNSSGRALGNLVGRSSLFIRNILPARISASEPSVLPLPTTGTSFYVTAASAPFEMRPANGQWNQYDVGTGLALSEVNTFNLLELRNTSANPIAFEIFVGFDEYIDNRVIISQTSAQQVIFPTYPTPNSAAAVEITDRSGAVITDINGGEWYAISRVAAMVFNPDSGVTLLVQESGSAVANGPAVGIVYPLTSLRLDAGGDFSLSVGGGNINAVVSEIYNALPKT